MVDDIVTRLRDIASQCWCAEKSQGEPVGKPFFRCDSCDDQLQAADEIERLRAAGERLKAALLVTSNVWGRPHQSDDDAKFHHMVNVAVDCWGEVRRD